MKTLILVLMLAAFSGPALAISMECGLPPLPPLGCEVGPCVCDENGDNCHYIMIC